VTELPRPSGEPASTFDPWAEQRRREAAHRLARRDRRRRFLRRSAIVVLVAAFVAGAVAGAVLLLRGDGDSSSVASDPPPSAAPGANAGANTGADAEADTGSEVSSPTPPTSLAAPDPTVPPERLVAVDEVWLLDRGDGIFDWGLTVVVPDDGPTRSGVDVTVRLLSADGQVTHRAEHQLDGVNAVLHSTVAGQLVDPSPAPVRLEFDITVGVPSSDLALDAVLSTRAVERIDDVIRGRIRSTAPAELTDVAMVLLWREPSEQASSENGGSGEVIAAVTFDVERLRPGVDAFFEIDLEEQGVPDGPPDEILWSPN
jgi:hypothetical protein